MAGPTKQQIEEYIRNNNLDVDESYPRSDWWKFKQQRNELIEDITKLRERNAELEKNNKKYRNRAENAMQNAEAINSKCIDLENENKALRLQANTYFEHWQESKRKAKSFDEILKIDNQATDEDRITGKYESDIETVISEYMEDE